MYTKIKNLLAILFIVILSASLYFLTLKGAPGNPNPETIKSELSTDFKSMELSPERGRFAHVLALGEYGSYELPQVLAEFVYPDVGIFEGRFYSFFAPGISYMAQPFYFLGKSYGLSQVFTFAMVSLFSMGAMIFMYLIGRQIFKLPIWASITAPIFFAFGSSAWSYATTLYQHHLTVFFFMAGFYSAWKYGEGGKLSWIWGFIPWAAFAAAFTVDYPNPLFLLPMMVYFFWRAWTIDYGSEKIKFKFRLSFIVLSIGFILITGWHFEFNAANFGGWQKLAGGIPSYKKIETKIDVINLNIPINSTSSVTGFGTTTITSVTATSTKEKSVVGFFSEKRLPSSGYILLASAERGLFIFWPLIIFSLFGIYGAFKNHRAEVSALCGGFIANMFLYFSWGDPWGGWAFGPRYMILSISILSIFVSYFIAKGNPFNKILVFEFFAYSSFISLVGVLTTNAVPPKVEAIPLGADYTYFRNLNFFLDGKSSSFFYNTYASEYVSLQTYGLLIYSILIITMLLLIFVFSRSKHEH